MTNSKKRSIKRIIALLLALSLVMTPAIAYATEFESIDFEPGQVCPYDEAREARIAELLEELEMIDEKLEELREQREVYLSKIALLTEQKHELQKRIDELRGDSDYYSDYYYSEVDADQETEEPGTENTSPEQPEERLPNDRPSNGGAVDNGRPNDAASDESNTRQPVEETPVNNVPENNQPALEAPVSVEPVVEYSPRVLEMKREHQLFLEQQGIEPEAPAVNNAPASDDSSIIVSVLHFFATPVHAFEGDSEYEFDYEPGYADLSGVSDLADFSNILDQLDENASLEELESALADVMEKLEQYTNALYALEAEIAYLEELREAVAAELDALVMGIMAFNSDAQVSDWAGLVAAVAAAPNTAPGNEIPFVIQLMNDIPNDVDSATLSIGSGGARNIKLVGSYTITQSSGSGSAVISVWNGSTLTIGEFGEPGPTITGGENSGIRVGANSTLTMNSGSIEYNSAQFGGGVHLNITGAVFNMNGGYVQNNHADIAGGGVFIANGAEFNMENGQILNNYARGDQYNTVDPISNLYLTFSGLSDAHSGSGGGVAVAPGGSFFMDGGTIAGNRHAITYPQIHRGGGGGVSVGIHWQTPDAVFEMRGGLITDNHTSAQGAGVMVHRGDVEVQPPSSHTFIMYGGTIEANHARIHGGGVATWGIFEMHTGAVITRNQAASLTPTGSLWEPTYVQRNEVNGVGGGVLIGQDQGRFTMHGGVISENQAANGGGVGMSAEQLRPPHFYMHGGQIIDNRAVASILCEHTGRTSGHGGGVYMRGYPRVYMYGGLVDGNQAEGHGGGFKLRGINYIVVPDSYNIGIGRLTITNGARVTNNCARNGGAIYTALQNLLPHANSIYVTYGVVFSGNNARNGLLVNDIIADYNANFIRPGTRTTGSQPPHAFTNHDIFVPTSLGLSLEKMMITPGQIVVGQTITYRLIVDNMSGVASIYELVLTDTLDPRLTLVPGSVRLHHPSEVFVPGIPNFTTLVNNFNPETRVLTIEIPGIARESDITIDFDVVVTGVGDIPNTAVVEFFCPTTERPDYAESNEVVVPVDTRQPTIEKEAQIGGYVVTEAEIGDTITYVLTVRNQNPVALYDFVVLDILPETLDFIVGSVTVDGVSVASPVYSFDPVSREFTIELDTIPARDATANVDGIVVITFQAQVLVAAADSTVPNKAVLFGPAPRVYDDEGNPKYDDEGNPLYYDERPIVDDDAVSVEIGPIEAELIKTVNPTTAEVGDTITYTLRANNPHAIDLEGFKILDYLPAGLEFADPANVTKTINGTPVVGPIYKINGREFSMIIDIPAAVGDVVGAVVVTFEAKVLLEAADSTVINEAVLLGSAPRLYDDEGNPKLDDYDNYLYGDRPIVDEDDVAVDIDPIRAELIKTVNPTTAVVGNTVTYTLRVNNPHAIDLEGFKILDILPSSLSFVGNVTLDGVSTSGYEIDGQAFSIIIDIPAEGYVVVTFQAEIVSLPAVNTADLLGPYAPKYDDYGEPVYDEYGNRVVVRPPISRDSATVNQPQPPTPTPDVGIIKSADPTVIVGENIVYTITVTNSGTGVATNVVVTDVLPDGVTFVSTDAADYNFNAAAGPSGTLTVNLGNMAIGATETFTVTVTADAVGTIINTAVVSGGNFTNRPECSATVNVLPEGAALLEIVKEASHTIRQPGQLVTYTFTVTNVGYENAYYVLVRDTLPAGLEFVRWVNVADADEYDRTGQDIWARFNGPLETGESFEFAIEARVIMQQAGTITNTARVYEGEDEIFHGDGSATITVRRPTGGGGNGYTPQPPGPGQNVPDPRPPVGEYPQDPPHEIEPPQTPLDPGPDRPGDQPPTGDVPRTGATGGSAGLMLLSLLAFIALAAIGRKRETDGLAHEKI